MIWPLDPLQTLLERIYGVSSELRVDDFLISDPCSVRQLHRGGRESREKLLISETGDELDVALFVHQKILNTLAADDPVERLHDGNLDAFWIALEGVSHFLYLSRSYLSRRRRVGLVEELRRFYRMPQSAKLRYIDHGTGR